jgi:hypothetical protein
MTPAICRVTVGETREEREARIATAYEGLTPTEAASWEGCSPRTINAARGRYGRDGRGRRTFWTPARRKRRAAFAGVVLGLDSRAEREARIGTGYEGFAPGAVAWIEGRSLATVRRLRKRHGREQETGLEGRQA